MDDEVSSSNLPRYVIALDQGTTSSRAIIFDENAKIIVSSHQEITQLYPQAGWVEHDPLEIWSSQQNVLKQVLIDANISLSQCAAIGITNQRETTIVWDNMTGQPIYNAIVWQSRQSADICQAMQQAGWTDYVRQHTGLVIDAYFSASKIRWILDHVTGAQSRAERGELLFGTVDTWLLWQLTQGQEHATDYTNASRSLLFDIHLLKWDQTLLDYFNIPLCMLPKVKPSSGYFGQAKLTSSILESMGEVEIPIMGMAGDQQAALFGQLCTEAGQAKNTYGTGCFLLMHTGQTPVHSTHGLLTTVACNAEGQAAYALEGAVFNAGASIQWLRDELKVIHDAADSSYYASKVKDSNGVYVVPAFTGLGAPYWDADARGAMFGLTRGTRIEHIIRATLESIAYQTADVLNAMQQDSQQTLVNLRVDGGATDSTFLMQFQADVLGVRVERAHITETTALGAALLAGLAAGVWTNIDEIRSKIRLGNDFEPQADVDTMQRLYRGWAKAVKRTQYWLKED